MTQQTKRAHHAPNCNCRTCYDERRTAQQTITTDAPTRGLHDSQVSVNELLGNSRVSYSVCEDWNDD